jgi:hypothetical protein
MTPLTRHNKIYGAHIRKRFRFLGTTRRLRTPAIAGNAADYFMG